MKPIVLAHGYLGFDNLAHVEYFRGVEKHLQAANHVETYATTVGPKDSVPERAALLESEIKTRFPGQSVHLIAHSMGGLDARYLLLPDGAKASSYIASLTTICTPHEGTYLAEIAMHVRNPDVLLADPKFQLMVKQVSTHQAAIWKEFGSALFDQSLFDTLGFNVKDNLDIVREVFDAVARGHAAPLVSYLAKLFGLRDAALPDLTSAGCQKLFAGEPASSATPCFSYGASARPFHTLSPYFLLPYLVLFGIEGPNDGVVPMSSARWRNSKSIFPTDHAGAIGWGPGEYMPWYDEIVRNIAANVPG